MLWILTLRQTAREKLMKGLHVTSTVADHEKCNNSTPQLLTMQSKEKPMLLWH